MQVQTMTQQGVHAYLHHMPIRGYSEDWPEPLYDITDGCVQKIFEYSKDRRFIPTDCTLDVF